MPRRESPLQSEMLQGTLDMLVLQTLVLGPAHGHTIAHAIEHGSEEVLQIEHGSLYPALHRLGRSRLDRILLGDLGEQSQSEVLPADAGGTKTIDCADHALGTGGSSDRPHPETGRGVNAMSLRRFFRRAKWDRERLAGDRVVPADRDRRQHRARHAVHEARAAACRKFGNSTLIREEIYRMNTHRVSGYAGPRPALRPAHAAPQSHVHRRRPADARHRNRRQHGSLQRRQ